MMQQPEPTPAENALRTRKIREKYPSGLPRQTVEDRIVDTLDCDIRDRCGLKWQWGGIDEEIMTDLLETWREIIRQELAETAPVTQSNDGSWIYITDPYQDYWQCKNCGTTVAVGRDDPRLRRDHKCPTPSP